ncbi:maleylpyruvate isomerase family mycothiol-dependent enzyme [Williamsia soli]|uniref:maleylpyruvate isomerase family mycothiol-dependent enzyme n=1 Tax=Williamsia soli TaxID=364929 RepID=UPI001A9FFFF0|nr:maleylpyruvate isomerase family mycothiol-dependent enzyme [Williamsia soli]
MGIALSDVWPVVHAERARLVEDLGQLADRSWATPSLCPGWDVHDVVAHLIDSAGTSRLSFVRRMIVARFDFDDDNASGISKTRCDNPRDTLEAMRAVVTSTRTPPANPATRLVEAFVHGEDIRRPLQIKSNYPTASVIDALDYQSRTSVRFGGGRERIEGLRLITTDTELAMGPEDGLAVRGRAIDLLLAVSGRVVSEEALAGPGAAPLTARTPFLR